MRTRGGAPDVDPVAPPGHGREFAASAVQDHMPRHVNER